MLIFYDKIDPLSGRILRKKCFDSSPQWHVAVIAIIVIPRCWRSQDILINCILYTHRNTNVVDYHTFALPGLRIPSSEPSKSDCQNGEIEIVAAALVGLSFLFYSVVDFQQGLVLSFCFFFYFYFSRVYFMCLRACTSFTLINPISQPLRSGRIWHRVNFLSGV